MTIFIYVLFITTILAAEIPTKNEVKTTVSKFPPVIEYVVQRIQGAYSVHRLPDESIILASDPKPVVEEEEVHTTIKPKPKPKPKPTPKPVKIKPMVDKNGTTLADIYELDIESVTTSPLNEVVITVTAKSNITTVKKD